MPPSLSLTLLGPFDIRLDREHVGGFEYNKVRALLAYLAVEAGQPHTRAHLCGLLWPNSTERAARQSLSQAVSTLRQALGDSASTENFILTHAGAVQLNPAAQVQVDVNDFSALIAASEAHAPVHRAWRLCSPCAARLAQAAALYRGDFLAQFFLSDSSPFEEWALVVRERLRQRLLSVLDRLAAYAEWRGAYDRAAEYARRQVDVEPLLESNHRSTMRRLALASQTTAALAQYQQLRRTLAAELAAEPEVETTKLYEQIKAGSFPGPATVARRLWPLPQPTNRLIGREHDLPALLELLQPGRARALTLTGSPGIGKTRLALELAHALRFDFEDGAAFVELAATSDPARVPATVAQAFGVRETASQPVSRSLVAALRDQHLLLVLDNFEHVLDAAGLVAELLSACPGLTVLATSRSPLHIRAEQQYALTPLELPDAGDTPAAMALAPAVALFVERAQAVRPDFALTGEHAGAVLGICAQLDGLPLAIELIAARAKTLAPVDLLRQLEHGLSALAHGSRDLPERQRTLSRSIAWSYDRLSAEAQGVFMHMGIFTGGCAAEAAQAVAGPSLDVLPHLEALAESSLIQAQTVSGSTRFKLLETLRAFALEQLAARGGVETAQQRHAAYYRALAERVEPELVGPNQKAWFDRLDQEYANLSAALSWGATSAAPEANENSLWLAAALEQFWEVRGHLRDGRRWLEAGLQPDRPASLEARAKAMRALGRTAYKMDDFKDAENWHRASRDLYLRLEDTAGLVRVLYNLGYCQARQGNSDAAQAFLDEALPLAHGLDDNYLLSCVLNALAEVADRRGDQALCRQYTEQALALTQARGDPRNSAGLLLNLGLTCYDEGDFATARQHIEASLAAAQALDDQHLIVLGLLNLGNVLIMQNAPAEACVRLEEAIARYKAQHNHSGSDAALGALGRALEKLGDLAGARGRHQEALRLRIEAGERRGVAVSLGSLARLDQREGRSQRAAQLLSASQAIREAIGSPISPSSRDEYALLVAAIKTSLGDEAFGPAWAAGHALSQDEAVALALGVPAVA